MMIAVVALLLLLLLCCLCSHRRFNFRKLKYDELLSDSIDFINN